MNVHEDILSHNGNDQKEYLAAFFHVIVKLSFSQRHRNMTVGIPELGYSVTGREIPYCIGCISDVS